MADSKIRVLSDHTINKIAAGEVIENPASVVKELVENSLDAGSTSICIEIQEGGRQLIRITDNGCGMTADDALLSLERHATSKIREVEDIQDVLTMGFRGEAVPSIAAISKFTLLTTPRLDKEKNEEGTLILVEGGRVLSCKNSLRSPGTTIEVKSLFFNVPVRRKFQKSPAYDHQEIVKVVELLALAHPTIQFELISDCKSVLKTSSSSSQHTFHEALGRRLEAVFGLEYASDVIPLHFQQGPYQLTGYIGTPAAHKPNRKGQYLFINQRAVYSPLIAMSVREGYGTMLPTHRYPLFVLHLRMPGSLMDVNVHPQKKEVRIRQESFLKEAIIKAVQTALRHDQVPLHSQSNLDISTAPPYWNSYAATTPSSANEEKWEFRTQPLPPPISFSDEGVGNKESMLPAFSMRLPEPTQVQEAHDRDFLPFKRSIPTVLATLSGYLLLEPYQLDQRLLGPSTAKKEGGLLLLDQRAAYSRIHYERLLKRNDAQEVQSLLIPLTLQLGLSEANAVKQYTSLLNEMGFSLREFGEQSFLIDAYPLFMKEEQLHPCLTLIIQDLVEMETTRRVQTHKEEHLAMVASRASLPTTKRLSLEEARELVKQLLACDVPSKCPLGGPIVLYLAPEELNKWFLKGASI